jgi:hypothetical protein
MQKFAPTKSRPAGNCPSDEELAAYIDGVLPREEVDRIAEHLVSCERCYAIYSETLQFQLDSAPPENVVPFSFRREKIGRAVIRYALPIAALLLVGLGSAYFFLASPPELTPGMVTALLSDKPGLLGDLWVGRTTRGPGDQEEIPFDEASFRMGVQLVNLQLSLEARDVEKAQGDILPRIHQVLETHGAASQLEDSFAALSADLKRKSPQEILKQSSQVAQESRPYFDETSLDLGQWVEGGRLAAMAQKPSFFQQSDNRAFLRHLLWNDRFGLHDIKLDPTTRASLDSVSDIISKGNLGASDYAELQHELEKILNTYYPMT